MIVEAIIFTVFMISAMILYKELPKTPPSNSGSPSNISRTVNTKRAICKLLKNKNYICIWLYSSIIMGVYQMICATLEQILVPFGYSST